MEVDDLSTFGVALLQLLDEAATNSSYKYALLLALTDAATESIGQRGGPRGSVTTEELARRVIDLYWPQSYPWPHAEGGPAILAALESKGRSIVDLIVSAREALCRLQAVMDQSRFAYSNLRGVRLQHSP